MDTNTMMDYGFDIGMGLIVDPIWIKTHSSYSLTFFIGNASPSMKGTDQIVGFPIGILLRATFLELRANVRN